MTRRQACAHDREYTLVEAAAELNCSVRNLHRLVAAGRIGHERTSDQGIRFRSGHLDAYQKSLSHPPK